MELHLQAFKSDSLKTKLHELCCFEAKYYDFPGSIPVSLSRNDVNYLHRNNAANIIKFFIENKFKSEEYQIFNCAEDRNDEQGNISNSKLKSLGFIFDEYD